MKKKIFISAVIVNSALYLLHSASFAQDVHFSQFYQTPLLINPALTGVFNGDMRAIVNYKDQWRVVNAYNTYALSLDGGVLKKKWKNAYIGLGTFLFKDVAGDSKMGTTQGNLSLSSIIGVGENQKLSAGLQGGFAQRSISPTVQKWGNQFCPTCPTTGYDPNTNSGENIPASSDFSFGDFSGGVLWTYSAGQSTMSSNNQMSFNAGIAFHHINRPKQEFLNAEKLYSRYVAHAGANIGLKNFNSALLPSVLLVKQGTTQEIILGMLIRYTIKEQSKYTGFFKETAVQFGAYYRAGDAVVPTMVIEYASYAVGVSYDVNISEFRTASKGQGGIEIFLRFISPNPFSNKSASRI